MTLPLPAMPITKARLRFFFYVMRYPANRLPALTGWTTSEIRAGLVRWRLRRDYQDDAEWQAQAGKQIRTSLGLPMNLSTIYYGVRLVAQGRRRLREQVQHGAVPWSIIDKAGSRRDFGAYLIAHASIPHQALARPWFDEWTLKGKY